MRKKLSTFIVRPIWTKPSTQMNRFVHIKSKWLRIDQNQLFKNIMTNTSWCFNIFRTNKRNKFQISDVFKYLRKNAVIQISKKPFPSSKNASSFRVWFVGVFRLEPPGSKSGKLVCHIYMSLTDGWDLTVRMIFRKPASKRGCCWLTLYISNFNPWTFSRLKIPKGMVTGGWWTHDFSGVQISEFIDSKRPFRLEDTFSDTSQWG